MMSRISNKFGCLFEYKPSLLIEMANEVHKKTEQKGTAMEEDYRKRVSKEWQEYIEYVAKKDIKDFKQFDEGPWEIRLFKDCIVLFSNDFTHDVTLSISGDFGNNDIKRPYMKALCYFLNNATVPSKTYSLKLKGKNKSWSIPILATEEDVEVWRKDGLEVIEIVEDE